MKRLIEIIAKSLVDEPDSVVVTEYEDDKGFNYNIRVSEGDMGKIIGKQGKIAKALRTVVKAAAIHNKMRVNVEIIQ